MHDVKALVVFVTVSSRKEAEEIANKLLELKKAACVNIVQGVNSLFWWQGKVESEEENLLIIKSNSRAYMDIEKIVKDLHSYEVPEIIALPVIAGSTDYLNWIDETIA